MDWREDLVGDTATGILASGPIVALMDSCAGASVWARSHASHEIVSHSAAFS